MECMANCYYLEALRVVVTQVLSSVDAGSHFANFMSFIFLHLRLGGSAAHSDFCFAFFARRRAHLFALLRSSLRFLMPLLLYITAYFIL